MSTPKGWLAVGTAPQDYELAVDDSEKHSGTRCAVIRTRADHPSGFCTLMQELCADEYRGQRVRLSAWVKTSLVEGRAWLWMRADSDTKMAIAFDNMQARPIHGSTEWTRHDVVLDIPDPTVVLAFGLGLQGPGTAWLDEVTLEKVGRDVPTTNPPPIEKPRQPTNLSFEA
ncbi:MAG: hypothetical protein ABI321_16480 [Polyangia bacterium]